MCVYSSGSERDGEKATYTRAKKGPEPPDEKKKKKTQDKSKTQPCSREPLPKMQIEIKRAHRRTAACKTPIPFTTLPSCHASILSSGPGQPHYLLSRWERNLATGHNVAGLNCCPKKSRRKHSFWFDGKLSFGARNTSSSLSSGETHVRSMASTAPGTFPNSAPLAISEPKTPSVLIAKLHRPGPASSQFVGLFARSE